MVGNMFDHCLHLLKPMTSLEKLSMNGKYKEINKSNDNSNNFFLACHLRLADYSFCKNFSNLQAFYVQSNEINTISAIKLIKILFDNDFL